MVLNKFTITRVNKLRVFQYPNGHHSNATFLGSQHEKNHLKGPVFLRSS